MTTEEVDKICKAWMNYSEINDKLGRVFHSIPESFLPYPVKTLEEAMNIMAKRHFDAKDFKGCKNWQEQIVTLIRYKDDEEALKDIFDDGILKNLKVRKAFIASLKTARDSWAEHNER